MPPRTWLLRIDDIIDAMEFAMTVTRGLTFDEFEQDRVKRDAVRYNMLVIGEAANAVPLDVQARHSTVPWREMRGMRNVVAHGYFEVSDIIVWDTIEQDLPSVVPALRQLIAAEQAGDEAGGDEG